MRDLNYRRSRFVESLEQLHNLFALIGVQIACRLIGENNLRACNDRSRYANQLLLSSL